jgi:nitrite reductase/ring-hydroxylating ferredoxin subunit/alkylhydroperoxidase/carboxymuconolactone decarboxylase family protein YurZ
MSDALDYLVKVRGDALGHYFAFLKEAGKHLDPKTRALISVITKVDAQTERGLRQYLKRALRDGCTPLEVLDALLMAFPTLGLSKIVWATDIILSMQLPGFEAEALQAAAAAPVSPVVPVLPVAPAQAEPAWHDLMATRDLAVGASVRVDCDGRGLFVHRASSRGWRVYDSRCPHQGTDMPALALQEGGTLSCPKHQWTFDMVSGRCRGPGDAPLTQHPAKVEAGRLLAKW